MLTLFVAMSALGIGFTAGLILAGCLTSGKVADLEREIWLMKTIRPQNLEVTWFMLGEQDK